MSGMTPEMWERVQRALEPLPERQAGDTVNREGPLLRSSGMPVREHPLQGWAPTPPVRRSAPEPRDDPWASWTRWAEGVNARLATIATMEVTAEGVGQVIRDERQAVKAQIDALRSDLAKSDAAVSELLMQQEKQISELKSSIAELEQRVVLKPVRPTLVIDVDTTGDSDAA